MYNNSTFYFSVFKKASILILLGFWTRHVSAQNFVADSSFEHNNGIPVLLSSIAMNTSWSTPSRGTTDLFCECGKKQKETSEAQVPYNPMGVQKANTGKCYAGIYGFSHGDYREYLQTQLTSPLSPGVKYEFNMWISLSDYSRAAIDQMGICFLSGKLNIDNSDMINGVQPVYVKIDKTISTDTVLWHQLSVEYKAKGGEQYLLIGSFDVKELEITDARPPKGVRTRINQRTERDAYYYIDDVSLRRSSPPVVAYFDTIVAPKLDTLKTASSVSSDPPKDSLSPSVAGSPESMPEIVIDKPFVLKNVLFGTNEAVLLQSSFNELDITAVHLSKNPDLKIEVNGHTDNTGNEIQNQKLSEERAKAVAEYLAKKNIDPARIKYKGIGSQKPIAENNTEEGRKQNRRVELLFSR